MRNNLPVTNIEHHLPDDCLIVSKTDVKGRITYYNQAFVDASGFQPEELMGQPHNIVRHPDMPPEAFQNLWDTLKAGRPWYWRGEEPPQGPSNACSPSQTIAPR